MNEPKENSLSLKSVTDALNMRSFILRNFEMALLTDDKGLQNHLRNFCLDVYSLDVIGRIPESGDRFR